MRKIIKPIKMRIISNDLSERMSIWVEYESPGYPNPYKEEVYIDMHWTEAFSLIEAIKETSLTVNIPQ